MKSAVVVPAHNEAPVIGETVRQLVSVIGADYPIFVIADRCEDDTAVSARAAGVRVYERREGDPGKGAALAWFLEVAALELADVEAVVILDADSRLRPGSIAALVRALEKGAAAAQAFVWPTLSEGSPGARLAAYSEWLAQAIDDRARHWLGWPVPLRGTGMAFRLRVLQELAPLLETRVEDVELTLLLVSQGYRIAFVPEAVVEDPKPERPHHLAGQRARWLQGQRAIWRTYRSTLLRLLFTGGPGAVWLLGTLLLKPRTLVSAVKALLFVALWPLGFHRVPRMVRLACGISLLFDVSYYLLGVITVPRQWRVSVASALLRVPLYFALWCRALVMSLKTREFWLRARD